MAKDKVSKYLTNDKLETFDDLLDRELQQNKKKSKKQAKKMQKVMLRDMVITESEDGVMTYFTGRGNYHRGAIRYGKNTVSRKTRIHNLKLAKEILWSEGVLTGEQQKIIDRKIVED